MKVIKMKKSDANSTLRELTVLVKLLKKHFGKSWNHSYSELVNENTIPELNKFSDLTGGSKASELIRAARNFVVFMEKWNDSESEE